MNLEDYFEINGTYELKDGVYNVKGSVNLIKRVEKLPVKFGIVTGDFNCSYNNLTSLKGSPTHVDGGFYCNNNKLTSLEGCPSYVGGNFYCNNNNLTSLEGSPNSVGGYFSCHENNLTSLKGAPTQIGGYFFCDRNLRNTKEYRQYLIMKELKK